jgi:glycosyltransferase involved in cell wall biosynthesis
MRVGLNATCFNERPSGAKQRFCGIYGALIQLCPEIEFVIYEPADCRVASWFAGANNVTVRRTPLPSNNPMGRTFAGLHYWPGALRRERLDLFEQFNLALMPASECPTILTLHDIRMVSTGVARLRRVLNRIVLRRCLRQADHVITVSNTMRQEILAFEPGLSVTTIYNGVNVRMFDQVSLNDAVETRETFKLWPEFILAVGHLETRKNYSNLVRAVAESLRRGQRMPLVIIGNKGGAEDAIQREINELGLLDLVRILSGVSDRELVSLYALASLVVFPSLYEGFGIPVLEAMAAHRPLVLSDIPVFRELTEGQGVYFPPRDIGAIAGAIAETVFDQERQRRIVTYGNHRVEAFSFENLARQVEQIYRRVLGHSTAAAFNTTKT